MPFTSVRGRCKNCRKLYWKTRENQTFCKVKCRRDFNNYGKTPGEQLQRRLNSFMRTEEFRELMREAVAKEVRAVMPENSASASSSGSKSPISEPNRSDHTSTPSAARS